MTIKNDYGLEGVASTLQYGKSGGKVLFNSETTSFNITLADQTVFADIKASDITSEDGNIIINSETGKFAILATNLSLEQEGVFKFEGTAAVSIPVGNNDERPTDATIGMVRVNNSVDPPFLEYYNGIAWVNTSSGGTSGGDNTQAVNDSFAISYFFS